MHTKKFALVGTSCVGKTTLLSLLEQQLIDSYKVKLIHEVSRQYFLQHKTTQPFSYLHQNEIQKLVLANEQAIIDDHFDIVLCDRSVLDAVVYVKAMGDALGANKLLPRAQSWLQTYNFFFLLDPKDVFYQTDRVRTEDEKLRILFHQVFIKTLEEIKLPYALITGNLNERKEQMIRIIREHV